MDEAAVKWEISPRFVRTQFRGEREARETVTHEQLHMRKGKVLEVVMKSIARILIAALFVVKFAAGLAFADPAHHCSNATGAGRWGFTVTGTILLPTGAAVPVVQVGRFTQDHEGNVVGTQTRSLGGSVGEETFTGTISTNSDCTGKATVNFHDKASGDLVRTSTLDFVMDEDGRASRAIVTSTVLPNGASLGPILTIEYRKTSPERHK